MTSALETKIIALSNKFKQLIDVKAAKTNGVNEITDTNSNTYTNIATMQSGSTQATINSSINTKLGNIAGRVSTLEGELEDLEEDLLS